MQDFDVNGSYRLVSVLDHEKNSKVHQRQLYEERIRCIATDFVLPDEDNPFLFCRFAQDKEGKWINRKLRTSPVAQIKKTERGFAVQTANSVYLFEAAELQPVKYLDVTNTIELYLSMVAKFHFVKGFYYDEQGQPYELMEHPHLGTFTDSVLIAARDREKYPQYMCRYFMSHELIEFYDTIYGQQPYETPIVIHNLDDEDIAIKREFRKESWVIPAGESAKFVPFDYMSEENRDVWMEPFSWDDEDDEDNEN